MQVSSSIPPSYASHVGWINGRGFLVLSETVKKIGNKISVDHTTDIYEFRIVDMVNPRLEIQKLNFHEEGPEPRTSPSVVFKDKFIFLLGG